jgi:hypothetical protein
VFVIDDEGIFFDSDASHHQDNDVPQKAGCLALKVCNPRWRT